jgi:hypothetical protein
LQDSGFGLKIVNDNIEATRSPAGISTARSVGGRFETAALVVSLNRSLLIVSRDVPPAVFDQVGDLLGVNDGGNGNRELDNGNNEENTKVNAQKRSVFFTSTAASEEWKTHNETAGNKLVSLHLSILSKDFARARNNIELEEEIAFRFCIKSRRRKSSDLHSQNDNTNAESSTAVAKNICYTARDDTVTSQANEKNTKTEEDDVGDEDDVFNTFHANT